MSSSVLRPERKSNLITLNFVIFESVVPRTADKLSRWLTSPLFSLAVIHKFDYVFAENGTVQYKDGKLLSKHVCARTEMHHYISPTL